MGSLVDELQRREAAAHDYWRYHLAREHQRLYPGTAQGQYTLSAVSGVVI
jgi:hypothetical protein